MEINIKKPKRKASRKGIRTKTRAAIQENIKQYPFKQKTVRSDKTNSNKILATIHQPPLKPDIDNQKSIEKIDDTISKKSNEKEERLLNLIVNALVRATLDQLYGKESN